MCVTGKSSIALIVHMRLIHLGPPVNRAADDVESYLPSDNCSGLFETSVIFVIGNVGIVRLIIKITIRVPVGITEHVEASLVCVFCTRIQVTIYRCLVHAAVHALSVCVLSVLSLSVKTSPSRLWFASVLSLSEKLSPSRMRSVAISFRCATRVLSDSLRVSAKNF